MRVGRNDECPCKSGKKFKNCCLAKIIVLDAPPWIPLVEVPFTVQLLLHLDHELRTDLPFLPLYVMGTSEQSVNFSKARPEISEAQLLTVGFVNREYRILAQIRTSVGIIPLLDNAPLPLGTYTVHVVVDHQEARLYVDANLRQSKSYSTAKLSYQHGQGTWFGSGEEVILTSSTLRHAFTLEQVRESGHPAPPQNLAGWSRNRFGINRTFFHGEPTKFAHVWQSPYFLQLKSKDDALGRFLALTGESVSAFPNRSAAMAAVATRLSQITDGLESIVNDPSKDEPHLLEFFKNHPGAAFLLEPSVVEQWRESTVQNHGRIDFVFKCIDGSFRVVEIERASRKLFKQDDGIAQDLNHAFDQVEKWIRGASKSPHLTQRDFGVIGAEWFHGLVVIGRTNELTNAERLDAWHARKQVVEVITWDDVITRGRLFAKRLNDPELLDYSWS